MQIILLQFKLQQLKLSTVQCTQQLQHSPVYIVIAQTFNCTMYIVAPTFSSLYCYSSNFQLYNVHSSSNILKFILLQLKLSTVQCTQQLQHFSVYIVVALTFSSFINSSFNLLYSLVYTVVALTFSSLNYISSNLLQFKLQQL